MQICDAGGCQTQCSFGFPGQPARRCRAHALNGMVSACGAPAAACRAPRAAHAHRASTLWRVGQVDVKSKKCEAGGCDKVARFCFPGGRAHALQGTVCPGAARLLQAVD